LTNGSTAVPSDLPTSKRSRCRSCRVSHVLLPTLVLLRRVDVVAVIGAALVAPWRS
jgi:hypothetical protein